MGTPAVRALLLAQQEEVEQLRAQLTALATELASLRERIGRSSRNSSKPPSSDGPGFKPPERRKGNGRKRGGQPGHPGAGPALLPMERVDKVLEHHPDACRRCGTLLQGEDPAPLRHQVIEIPPITPVVIEHRLHRLVCPCCSTSTCATVPADVEATRSGHKLSALVGLLGSALSGDNEVGWFSFRCRLTAAKSCCQWPMTSGPSLKSSVSNPRTMPPSMPCASR